MEDEEAEALKKEQEEEEEEKAKVCIHKYVYVLMCSCIDTYFKLVIVVLDCCTRVLRNIPTSPLIISLPLLTLLIPNLFHCSQDDEDSELKSLITSFKNLTGLWDIDPDDSAWYHLEQKDKNDPSIVVPMGSICYRYAFCCLSLFAIICCV